MMISSVYGLDSNPPSGAPSDHPAIAGYRRFRLLLKPWIDRAGSALDVEETLLALKIPTDHKSWLDLGENEIAVALGVAEFYGAFAGIAFKTPGTVVEFNQIGPALGGIPAPGFVGNVPMQAGLSTGVADARSITFLEFENDATLAGLGDLEIAEVNRAVIAAGLLQPGQEAIGVGKNRVTIRPEFFTLYRPGTSSAATRDQVPFISGLGVLGKSTVHAVSLVAGTPVPGDEMYRLTDHMKVVVQSYAAGSLVLRSREGALAVSDVLITWDGVKILAITGAAVVTTVIAEQVVKSSDVDDGTAPPTGKSQYPNHQLSGGSMGLLATVLKDDLVAVAERTLGGNGGSALGGPTTQVVPNHVFETFARLSSALSILAAETELLARESVTSTAELETVRVDLLTRKVFPSAISALGFNRTQVVDYTGYLADEAIPVFPDNVAFLTFSGGAIGYILANEGDSDGAGAGRAVIHIISGVFASGETADVAGETVTFNTDVTVENRGAPPAIMGYSVASLGSNVGLSWIAELEPRIGSLSASYIRLHSIAGGFLATLSALAGDSGLRPSATELHNHRHVSVCALVAWIDEIAQRMATDSDLYMRSKADLSKVGWRTDWLALDSVEIARRLSGLDPTLHESYLDGAIAIANNIDLSTGVRFGSHTTRGHDVFKPSQATPGTVFLDYDEADIPKEGDRVVLMVLRMIVPPLPGDLESGAVRVTLPEGMTISQTLAAPVGGNGTLTVTQIDAQSMRVVFSDTVTPKYRPNTVYNLAIILIQLGDKPIGSFTQPESIVGVLEGSWAADDFPAEQHTVSRFQFEPSVAVTERGL